MRQKVNAGAFILAIPFDWRDAPIRGAMTREREQMTCGDAEPPARSAMIPAEYR
jgi:hypothetical protein